MSLETLEMLKMLRHLHNDIENVKRTLIVVEHKVNGLAYLIGDTRKLVSKGAVESVISPDPGFSLDDIYSPIDEQDRIEWNEHLKEESRSINRH